MYQLKRATCINGSFAQISEQWLAQIAEYNGTSEPEDYLPVMMSHAQQIAGESPPDRKYGIFYLEGVRENGSPSYEGLIHVNHKLPNTSAATLRMVWNLLAPKYDYIDTSAIGSIMASYVVGGIRLCRTNMRSASLQMYLHNGTDRQYALGAVGLLKELHPELDVNVRGMWLHINNINVQRAGDIR